MAQTQTFNLSEYWNEFIANELAKGHYGSASEVVHNALQLLQEYQSNTHLEAIRTALIEGEESGDAGILDMQSIKDEARRTLK